LVYRRNVVVAVLLVVVGPAAPTKTNSTAVDRLLMMGIRMPETRSAVFERHAINL
jgi:hypothetical protein